MLVIMAYDWLILLDREIEHVWGARWGTGKILYLASRYWPFLDMPIIIVIHTAPSGTIDDETCAVLYRMSSWGSVLGICISESILLLRTSAIYAMSKRINLVLSICYGAGFVGTIIVTWDHLRTIAEPPLGGLFLGCNFGHDGKEKFSFLLLLGFELVVVILTVRKGFSYFHEGTPLLRVLYRDSIAYFLVLFGKSTAASRARV